MDCPWKLLTLSIVAETPFILNATVRDNILFGHVNELVDEDRYQSVLDCCALRHDLELLPGKFWTAQTSEDAIPKLTYALIRLTQLAI